MIRILSMLLLLLSACEKQAPLLPEPSLQLAAVLGGDNTAGFQRAEIVREFSFPNDHGLHAGFRNEWWYFTGNLQTNSGRRFGYQLTFFTAAQPSRANTLESAWASDTVWMAHLAVTDVETQQFFPFERFSRGSPGLAGAQALPFRVWLDDWQVVEQTDGWHLRASEQGIAIDLVLNAEKPPVLQGDAGLSRKGATTGNASYYYSMTRLRTSGSVNVAGVEHAVTGQSWLDREWSTSALESGVIGWDWLSLQFDDNTELMAYQLRDGNGAVNEFSDASITAADGAVSRLALNDVSFEPLQWWTAPDGVRYATQWSLVLNGRNLTVEALMDAQYLPLALHYWEGAVRVIDSESSAITGYGYLEMVRQ